MRFNQWKENKDGRDLRAVELTDGRARVDDTAETTQNEHDKEKEEDLKYNPDGSRIFKDSSESGERKYIIGIVGYLPVILSQLNNSGGIVKTYIYANSQIIAQHAGSRRYRLGALKVNKKD